MILKIKYIDDNLLKFKLSIYKDIETIYELDKFIYLVHINGNHTKFIKDNIEFIEINPISY